MLRIFNECAAGRHGLVLLYHGVWERVPAHLGNNVHNVRPEVFNAQINWLLQHFDVVSIDDFMGFRKVEGKAAITFDDGYRSVFDFALPVLRARGLPATVFLNAGTLEGAPLWRDKIRFLMMNRLVSDFLAWRREKWPDTPSLDEATFYRKSKTSIINSRMDRPADRRLYRTWRGLGWGDTMVSLVKSLLANGVGGPSLGFLRKSHLQSFRACPPWPRAEQAREIRANEAELKRLSLPLSGIFALPFGGLEDFNSETVKILRPRWICGRGVEPSSPKCGQTS